MLMVWGLFVCFKNALFVSGVVFCVAFVLPTPFRVRAGPQLYYF